MYFNLQDAFSRPKRILYAFIYGLEKWRIMTINLSDLFSVCLFTFMKFFELSVKLLKISFCSEISWSIVSENLRTPKNIPCMISLQLKFIYKYFINLFMALVLFLYFLNRILLSVKIWFTSKNHYVEQLNSFPKSWISH